MIGAPGLSPGLSQGLRSVLKYNSKAPLLKSSKYTMQLQYDYKEEGLMSWNDADMLRMFQFLELAHSQVRPQATVGKNYPGCPAPFGRNIPYIGYDSVLPNWYH